ncbi:MAG: hypothetical protein JXQ73_26260 [Phycisphaerae bacterium]|nr:hypothetical protein [Phycisphaerae bacterium]
MKNRKSDSPPFRIIALPRRVVVASGRAEMLARNVPTLDRILLIDPASGRATVWLAGERGVPMDSGNVGAGQCD